MPTELPQQEPTPQHKPEPTLHPFRFENIFTLKGRLNRLDFTILWMMLTLIIMLIMQGIGGNPLLTSMAMLYEPESMTAEMRNAQFINFAGIIGLLLLAIRRLHDLNYKSWFTLGLLIPIVGFIFRLILIFAPGNSEKNQFGDIPPANHRNKVLILLVLLAVIYMVFNSFVQEAMPQLKELIEELTQQ